MFTFHYLYQHDITIYQAIFILSSIVIGSVIIYLIDKFS